MMPLAAGRFQTGQKSFDFGLRRKQSLPRMCLVQPDKLNNPIDVRALSVNSIVEDAEDLTDFVQEFRPLTFVGDRHSILIHNRHALRLIMGKGQNCPKTRLLSKYQGKIAC